MAVERSDGLANSMPEFQYLCCCPKPPEGFICIASDVLTAGEIAHHLHSKRHDAFLCHRSGMTCESARARSVCGRCALAETAEQPPHLRSSMLPASCRTKPLQVLLLQCNLDKFTTAVVASAQNLFHACSLNTFLRFAQQSCAGKLCRL